MLDHEGLEWSVISEYRVLTFHKTFLMWFFCGDVQTNGDKQAEDISDLLHSLKTVANAQTAAPIPCFQNIRIVSDFFGIKRFVVATRCCWQMNVSTFQR